MNGFACLETRSTLIYLENVVSFAVEDHDALVKMMVLHGAGSVKDGKRRFRFCLEGIVRPSVVQIVAETGDK